MSTVCWILLVRWMAARFALDDEGLEWIAVPLPTEGHSIGLTHHMPAVRRFAEPVIVCHGLAVNRFNMDFLEDHPTSGDRASLARTIARAGFDTWLLELRGRGRVTAPRGADWSIDDEVREDVPVAIQTVLERTGAKSVFWVAHSKGAILQYLFQARGHPLASKVAGLVAIGAPGTMRYQARVLKLLVRPGRFILRAFGRVPMRALSTLFLPLVWPIYVIGRYFSVSVAANEPPQLRRVLATLPADISSGVARQFLDWLASDDGALSSRDGIRDEENFNQIRLPIYLIAGSADNLAPPPSVEHVATRVGSSDLRYEVLGKATGAINEYGHGDLVVGRHAPAEVFPKVIGWLEEHATSDA